MSEYKVVAKEVTSVVWRDLHKAAQELAGEVNTELSSGWEPQGGNASVQAGTGVYLIQALAKRRCSGSSSLSSRIRRVVDLRGSRAGSDRSFEDR